jgi:hypothetical protein
MAALPANATSRYFVKYFSAGRTHKASFRYTGGSGLPTPLFIELVGGFFDSLHALISSDFVFVSASYIAEGTNIELPMDTPPAITPSTVALTLGDSPRYVSFVGRGPSGHKIRVYVFGISLDPGDSAQVATQDYRVLPEEITSIGNALTALVILNPLTIGGDMPIWHQYANVGYNVHFQKKARRG